jgi:hypothetical protein
MIVFTFGLGVASGDKRFFFTRGSFKFSIIKHDAYKRKKYEGNYLRPNTFETFEKNHVYYKKTLFFSVLKMSFTKKVLNTKYLRVSI